MLEIRRILFPVDFSERCSAAASHVAAMARQFHAKVTLLHVIRTPRVWQGDLVSGELEALIDMPQLINAMSRVPFCIHGILFPISGRSAENSFPSTH